MKRLIILGLVLFFSSAHGAQITIDDVVSNTTPKAMMQDVDSNFTELYGKWTALGADYDTAAELSTLFTGKQDADPFLADIAALTDPNADRILFWDDSAGDFVFLTLGTNLSITDATLNAAGGSATVEDTVYGATWNGDTDGTSKNTIYDYLVNFDADADGDFTDESWFPSTSGAPTNATYLTTSAEAGLSAEIVVSANGVSLITAANYAAMVDLLETQDWNFTGDNTMGAITSLALEGATADDYEAIFNVADPTADRQIYTLDEDMRVPASDQTNSSGQVIFPVSIGVACSDESTDLTTGTAKVTFRAPYAFTLTGARISVNTAPVGSTITVDINEGGTSVFSTILSIDASEKTSTSAATAAVISDSAIADDAEITIDIDQIGSTTAGKGLKVWLIGTRTL